MIKITSSILLVLLMATIQGNSQSFRKNSNRQSQKEDANNVLNSEDRSQLDILEALDFAGIKIHKFRFAEFDTSYKITFIVEEFEDKKLKEKTILFSDRNYYRFWDHDSVFFDYVDQAKFVTKDDSNGSKLFFKTYQLSSNGGIQLNKNTADLKRFYIWRDYIPLKWHLDKKTPVMLYASSWFDKDIGQYRFCGASILEPGEENTEIFLSNSPHYFLISYIVSKL
ncbi:hypothetical protein [Niabella hirudinis]|uniref:hypothetical protein n=1 Tax=Niabella hirudinis TaxID=1285929 RepID=UPI003EBA13DA